MKFTLTAVTGLIAIATVFSYAAGRASGQETRPAVPGASTRPSASRTSTRPGDAHERLARRVGKYTTSIAYKPKAPTGDIVTTGEAELRMTLDGRFLVDENTGVLLGKNFNGFRMTGYNNASGKYEASWADTNSTGLVRLLGESDDNGKTVVYTAMLETESGPLEFKATDRQVDDDSFVITITSSGSVLDITYKRRK